MVQSRVVDRKQAGLDEEGHVAGQCNASVDRKNAERANNKLK